MPEINRGPGPLLEVLRYFTFIRTCFFLFLTNIVPMANHMLEFMVKFAQKSLATVRKRSNYATHAPPPHASNKIKGLIYRVFVSFPLVIS